MSKNIHYLLLINYIRKLDLHYVNLEFLLLNLLGIYFRLVLISHAFRLVLKSIKMKEMLANKEKSVNWVTKKD